MQATNFSQDADGIPDGQEGSEAASRACWGCCSSKLHPSWQRQPTCERSSRPLRNARSVNSPFLLAQAKMLGWPRIQGSEDCLQGEARTSPTGLLIVNEFRSSQVRQYCNITRHALMRRRERQSCATFSPLATATLTVSGSCLKQLLPSWPQLSIQHWTWIQTASCGSRQQVAEHQQML